MDADMWAMVSEVSSYLAGGSAVAAVLRAAALAFFRRPKFTTKEIGPYFTEATLLAPPLTRPAYSDRMAHLLAEMSGLAYYQFEGRGGIVDEAVEKAQALTLTDQANVREFLDRFATDLLSGRRLSQRLLEQILHNSGFTLLGVINVDETQGFVCKRQVDGEPPYLVLAFRGTEKKVSDWLTDARCVPTIEGTAKVHTGFLEAFTVKRGGDGRTVKDVVDDILGQPEARGDDDQLLPLYITGHSLGGALALLATKLVAPNVNGACYTFGAPRVGNYEYFSFIKTPVYRIVNSADVVPRVPPGPFMIVLRGAAQAMSWLTGFIPAVAQLFDRVEESLDGLKGYRHYGDLRYLSDVAEGRFQDVRLLPNPPASDRVMWAFRRMVRSILVPLKSHNMNIYRRKLAHVANERNIAPRDSDRTAPAATRGPGAAAPAGNGPDAAGTAL